MMGWILLLVGTVLAVAGMTAAVGSAVANRMELYRWITTSASGCRGAHALVAAPERIVDAAEGIAILGVLVASVGFRTVLSDGQPGVLLMVVLLVAVPIFLIIVYSLPRAVGRRWAEDVVRWLVPWVDRFAILLAPITPSPLALGSRSNGATASRVDGGQGLILDTKEINVVSGVLAFTERPVREVMTPRTEITAVSLGTSLDDLGRIFAESGHSRIPVYQESLDDIVGMYYAFDLLKLAPGSELQVRDVTMTPGSNRCADLLFEMQRDRHQMSVVLDEYGGTAGIATFEDLLEELVEETVEPLYPMDALEEGGETVIEVVGATPVEDVAARLHTPLPDEAETIGGLLTRAAGRIPHPGERFELAGLEFDVLSATPIRVERVVVRKGLVRPIHLGPGSSN